MLGSRSKLRHYKGKGVGRVSKGKGVEGKGLFVNSPDLFLGRFIV